MSVKLVVVFLLSSLVTVLSQHDMVFVKDVEEEQKNEVVEEAKVELSEDYSGVPFIPTTEWQEILPGQHIPQGLHVRLDMQTGLKEAKLLEVEETEEQRHARIVEAMRNIKDDGPKVQGTGKSKWRSMEELKEELKAGDMEIRMDYLTMQKLVESFEQSSGDTSVQVSALEELEYLTHQYDNGLDFLTLGGLERVLLPGVNSTTGGVRQGAAFLLGGAASSHPEVQAAALTAGMVPILLRLTHLDPEPEVATKAFYALSAIIRNNPTAQAEFLRQGGLAVLTSSLEREGKSYEKLRIKILTLLHDLLTEMGQTGDTLGLEGQIREAGLCGVWSRVLVVPRADRGARREDHLSTLGEHWPLRQEHDVVEKVLKALGKVVPLCKHELSSVGDLGAKLAFLEQEYSVLRDRERAEEEGDTFFSEIAQLLGGIREELGHGGAARTEL